MLLRNVLLQVFIVKSKGIGSLMQVGTCTVIGDCFWLKICIKALDFCQFCLTLFQIMTISNSYWTEWSTIQGVVARGRFEITSTITP